MAIEIIHYRKISIEGDLALQPTLSDISQIQAQNNTLVPTHKALNRVGFEPTTTASQHVLYFPIPSTMQGK